MYMCVCACFLSRSKYNLEIADYEQPLLIHREKKREARGQPKGERQEAVICLIPELCSMTGLTDMARSDFRVMKDIAAYTKITPAQRDLGFKKFLNNLSTNPDAMKELTSWGLQLSHSTLSITGRLLPSEKITFGKNTIEVCTCVHRWTAFSCHCCTVSVCRVQS